MLPHPDQTPATDSNDSDAAAQSASEAADNAAAQARAATPHAKEPVPTENVSHIQVGRKERRAAEKRMAREGERSGSKKPLKHSQRLRAQITSKNAYEFNNKNNRVWDEVQTAAQKVFALLSLTIGLTPILSRAELTSHYPDINYTGRVAMALVAEVTALHKEFAKVASSHRDRTGRAENLDDMLKSYEVYNNYMIILEKYNSGASVLFDTISEQVGMAIKGFSDVNGNEEGTKLSNELRDATANAILRVNHAKRATDADLNAKPEAEAAAQAMTEPA